MNLQYEEIQYITKSYIILKSDTLELFFVHRYNLNIVKVWKKVKKKEIPIIHL